MVHDLNSRITCNKDGIGSEESALAISVARARVDLGAVGSLLEVVRAHGVRRTLKRKTSERAKGRIGKRMKYRARVGIDAIGTVRVHKTRVAVRSVGAPVQG